MTEVIDRPLLKLAETFEHLAARVNSQSDDLDLGLLSLGFSLLLPLLHAFGIAFKLVEMDAAQKVNDLLETAKSTSSVKLMIEADILNDCVRTPYSHSRNLLRLIRALDFCRLFSQNLLNEDTQKSPRIPATAAYQEVFGPYHGHAVKMIFTEGIRIVPTMSKIYKTIKEDEQSARVLLQNLVRTTPVVINYLHQLFISRNLGIDW